MSEKKENKSFLRNKGNVSLMSKTSTSNKSSAQFIKGADGRSVPTAVPFIRNGVDEPGGHIAVVQAAEQRRAAGDLLIDKIVNGDLRLKLEVLEKVLPSLASKITFEKLSKEMRIILNVSELTEHRPGQAQSKPEINLKSKELVRKEEKIEESNKNTELSRYLMLKKPDLVKNARAVSVLSSKLPDLFKVLTLLTGFCKNIFVHLKIFVERQPITDAFEVAASNFKQLIRWKISLPKHLLKKYNCAKLFYEFSTGFYVDYFSNFFTENESVDGYLLRTHVVDHFQELARWLELYILPLAKLEMSVLHLNGETSFDDYEELCRGFLSEQKKMFLEFRFSDPPCDNADFALQLIFIVNVLIKDLGSELSVMWENVHANLNN